MGIVLEPLAPPQLASIPVSDGLFGIGRDSEPFRDLDVAAGLAVQHAYIFRERGGFHLMAVEGETTHNGRPLPAKRPIELTPGDEIGFADTLHFRIAAGKADVDPATLRVSLIPAENSVNSETIVLESLPFLVSRETVLFQEYETTMPAAVRTLSRHHAFLYARDGDLYLKDLGSTNGTWVGDQRLEPHAEVPVYAGETLAFGSPLLSYTVQLERLDAEAPTRALEWGAGEATSGMHRVDKTVYIRTADSFLDIFLDRSAGEPPEAEEEKAAGEPGKPIGKLRAFSRGLREALADEQPHPRRRPLVWAVAGAILVLALGGAYVLYDTPKREVAELLEQGQSRAALVRAGVYRDRYPADAELESLATEALGRWLVPSWLQAMDEGAFAAGAALLAEARASGPLYPESERLLSLLGWMGDLERFTAERGGSEAPLVLFRDERTITALLQRWEAEANGFDLLLVKLARQVPAFQDQRARVLSRLRALRNEQTVYLRALDELRRDLQRQLVAGDTDAAMLQVARFERRYPRIVGLAPLREDIARMERLQKALADGDMDALMAAHRIAFETPWLRELALETLKPKMPATTTLERYRQALEAWKDGDARQAIVLLRELAGQEGAADVTDRLRHFERVVQAMDALPSARQQADYGKQLLVFARTLDPEQDRYFLAILGDELVQQKAVLRAEIDTLLAQAREHWNAYRDAGGISGLMRLEDTVSETFRTQSQRLLSAYRAAEQALQDQGLLDRPPPDNARRLHQAILREVRLQRRSFTDLGLVMEPALLRDKLQLLPEPDES